MREERIGQGFSEIWGVCVNKTDFAEEKRQTVAVYLTPART